MELGIQGGLTAKTQNLSSTQRGEYEKKRAIFKRQKEKGKKSPDTGVNDKRRRADQNKSPGRAKIKVD